MTETAGACDAQCPDSGLPSGSPAGPLPGPRPMAARLGCLARLAVLAAAGAAVRALYAPPAYAAVAAWLVLAAALTWVSLRRFWTSGRQPPRRQPYPGGCAWRPGDPAPEGIPVATMEAAGRILARDPGGRRAQLRIAACEDPLRHRGLCQGSATAPGARGVTVILGEHAAQRPSAAAFRMAHEIHHTFGWRWYAQAAGLYAWASGWLAVGWAVPWPWLPAALAGLQCGHLLSYWAVEIACDAAAARMEGRDAAGASFAADAGVAASLGQAQPAWRRRGRELVFCLAGQAGPPLRLRRVMVLAMVRT